MIFPAILDLVQLCFQANVRQFVVCPGSRSAPLTIALVRHGGMQLQVVDDERSAAYTALGIALQTQQTVGLVCTSGTAALNFAPAIAEAFYQEVPLLVLTADRPPEWIDQQDGQAIRQQDLYGKHVKKSWQFPIDFQHKDALWFANRIVNEAILLAQSYPKGAVHINVPFREPFYPQPQEKMLFPAQVRQIKEVQNVPTFTLSDELKNDYVNAQKVLCVIGHRTLPIHFQLKNVPVVADVTANCTSENTIRHHDIFLKKYNENLQPDLLITFGNGILSKSLKHFLRKLPPKLHWHIQEAGEVADGLQSLTHIIRAKPEVFVEQLTLLPEKNKDYETLWQQSEQQASQHVKQQIETNTTWCEWKAVAKTLQAMPQSNVILHLANSMPVRYVNQLASCWNTAIPVFCNRGTSGIDGSTSTAVGAARHTEKIVVLFTGDIAFFYDRNALWQYPIPANLRIVLLNNQGGNIFRMIEGPAQQPELATYFETYQPLNAKRTAQDAEMNYFAAHNEAELQTALSTFFEKSTKAAIVEIFTNSIENTKVFKAVSGE